MAAAFNRTDCAGGRHVKKWLNSSDNTLYSALCFQGGANFRAAIERDCGSLEGVREWLAHPEQGKPGEALPLQRQVLEVQERVLSPEHPQTLRTTAKLAGSLSDQDKHPEAQALIARTVV